VYIKNIVTVDEAEVDGYTTTDKSDVSIYESLQYHEPHWWFIVGTSKIMGAHHEESSP